MLNLKFYCSFWLALYLAAVQYLTLLFLIPIIMGINIMDSSFVSLSMFPVLIFCLLFFIAIEDRSLGLITLEEKGISGYALRQFGKSLDFIQWDDIYRVEPYRYYGLPFLLVRYHNSEYPLWLPLFLKSQNKLNFVILERTTTNNPLHIALLLKTHLLKQVPWHSKLKKHKSDRYFLERCYSNIFSFSLQKYALFATCVFLVFLIITVLSHEQIIGNQYVLIDAIILTIFFLISFSFVWYFIFKDFSIEIKNTGIGFCTKSLHKYHQWFVPWAEIIKVEYNRFLLFSEIRVFSQEANEGYFDFSKILLSLINQNKFKATIINNLPVQNILYQVVVRYL
jgi:hypothetical protein